MKHLLLLLVSFFTAFCASGQFNYIHSLGYRTDTFHFEHLFVLKQRYEQRDLMKVPEDNIQERILAANIGYLQGSLDQMNKYIIEEKDVFYNLRGAEGHIRDIKNADPTFDCSLYEQEMNFYKSISDGRYDAAQLIKKIEANEKAELEKQKEAEERRQKDEENGIGAAIERREDSLEARELNKQIKKEQKDILKKYGPVNGKAINNGKVLLGMTPAMCELAWGQPLGTSKSTTAKGTTEKWIYTKFQYLVFTNGRVSAIHEGGVVEY